ncbi:hypothetical protein ACIA6C_15160 [Streptomyces sp. NPDC051578]|uniref:hypothetical protein n=1 Tax=Streptomyces sp. NPDC051578 TaxID=3365662 RepID=UPI0037A88FED
MTDQYSGLGAGTRAGIAHVCERLERIREDLQNHSAQGAAPLDHLMSVLRAGEDPTVPLEALHEALLAAGDARGINGGQGRGLNLIGADSAMPAESVLLCPTGLCSRFGWPDGPGTSPCRISGRPLRTERL